jgi:hypothetical protein
LQWAQTDAGIFGTLRASDAEGDPISYVVTAGPTYGTVTIASDGSYTYTPDDPFDDSAHTDSFTVKIADQGWHLNLLNLFAPRYRDVTVPVEIQAYEYSPVLTQPEDTFKFTIYNFSSKNMTFDGVEHQDSGADNHTPEKDAALPIGGKLEFFLEDEAWSGNYLRARFKDDEGKEWHVTMTVPHSGDDYTSDFWTNGTGVAWTGSGGENQAKAEFFDAPNTVVNLSIDDDADAETRKKQVQEVADVLSKVCESGAAKCKYEPVKKEVVDMGYQLATEPLENRTPEEQSYSVTYTQTESVTSSFSLTVGATFDSLIAGVEASVEASYGREVSSEESEEFNLTINVGPGSEDDPQTRYLYWTEDQEQYNGGFNVKYGNTTYNLSNIKFRFPAQDIKGRYIVTTKPMQKKTDEWGLEYYSDVPQEDIVAQGWLPDGGGDLGEV